MSDEKLYVIVRGDLAPGLLCAQACHGMRAFQAAHPEAEAGWFHGSNNIAILSVQDEPSLVALLELLESSGAPVASFREPDIGDQLTAIATIPKTRRALARLPLALAS